MQDLWRHVAARALAPGDARARAQVSSIVATGLGAVALTRGPFPRANFFVAGVAVYMGTIVLEAVSMSLCSKARPAPARPQLSRAWARAPAHVPPTHSLNSCRLPWAASLPAAACFLEACAAAGTLVGARQV